MLKLWTFWSPRELALAYPTRKKRRKFFQLYRKQHQGKRFCGFIELKRYGWRKEDMLPNPNYVDAPKQSVDNMELVH